MEKFICKECDKVYETLKGLSNHRFQKHKIKPQNTYDEYVLNGVKPTCNCGCGVVPKFLTITNGYREYVRGHSSRINNNWGHNIEAIRKSHETQKKMYESGELTIWNKGLTIDDPRVKDNIDKVMSNPNRGKNISKKLSGVFKSEKHKEKLSKIAKKRWSNPEERKKQRERKVVWIKKNGFNKQSKLEKSFEGLLINLGINFEPQYPVNGYLYDFYIVDKNTLIEVDGDWFHFNKKIHKKVTSIVQENTINNDKIKNNIAKKEGYNLIRFWEDDINNNLDNVINTLKLLL
jgi:very-short-patch-repair endonuclease